jgi:hypothetical protein
VVSSITISGGALLKSFLRCKTDASPFEGLLRFETLNDPGDRIQLSTLIEIELEEEDDTADEADPARDIFPRFD